MITFLHPYIQTQIVDNSSTFETATGGGTALFQPYLSDKGEDGKIELITSLADMLVDKGLPNYKKHGQSIYNMINWLKGGGRVYGLRLTADNAAYANTVLNVKTKTLNNIPVYEKDENGEFVLDEDGEKIPVMTTGQDPEPVTQNGIEIKLVAQKIEDVTDISDLLASLENAEAVDQDGFKNHPLFLLRAKGKGDYGNNLIYRLSLNNNLEDTYDFRLYNLTILEKSSTGTLSIVEGPMSVSMFPEALSLGGTSLFANQVITDYYNKIEMVFSEKYYDMLIDDILAATQEEGVNTFANPQTIDFIFARDKANEPYEKIIPTTGGLLLDRYTGIAFEEGSDGDFALSTLASTRNTAIQNKLVAAYNGTVTREVLNKKKFPFDIIMDANYALPVKEAISDLCIERGDVFGILDTGILATPAASLTWRKNSYQVDSICSGIWGQSWTIYDIYTAQDIPVTTSYFLARKIPENDRNFGIQYPFVGPNRGIISGFKSLNWNPDEYEKEDLYKARINYAEQDYKNTKFMSQQTSQLKTSALSNVNNVRVLFRMVRVVNELAERYQFEFPDTATMNSFNADLTNYLNEWVANGTCAVCTGTAYQTGTDKELKIARVKISIIFNNVIERILIEFNIGK